MASEGETHFNEHKDENFGYAMQLVISSAGPMALNAAIELGIFEIIGNAGPDAKLSASEIALKMPTRNPNASVMLDRILGLLASHQVLDCSLNGLTHRLYSLNSVSKYLAPNQNGQSSLAPLVALIQGKETLQSWYELKDAVLEGGSPFKRLHGKHVFEYCGIDPSFNQVMNTALVQRTNIVMDNILERYKGLQNLKHLVDVGGGLGIALEAITSKYPHIKGVEHVAGDMFESVPKGDAIFLKSIIHDWGDEQCLRLLKNCYEALPDDGKVIVVDAVLPVMPKKTVTSKTSFQFDVLMMVVYGGGKERTEHELLALATSAGFRGINYEMKRKWLKKNVAMNDIVPFKPKRI